MRDHSADAGRSPLAFREIFNATVEPREPEPEDRLRVAARADPWLNAIKAMMTINRWVMDVRIANRESILRKWSRSSKFLRPT